MAEQRGTIKNFSEPLRLLLRLDLLETTHVRTQHFRNQERAVLLLVVVADAHHHARGGEAGTVQRVHEGVLAVNLRLDVSSACLVVFEVRAGADFFSTGA